LWLIGPVTRPALSQPRHAATRADEQRPVSTDPDRDQQTV